MREHFDEGAGAQADIEAKRWSSSIAQRLFGAPATTIRIGRYTVQQRIGAGASGVVYSAHDPELERTVAVKLLQHTVARGDSRGARLRREAQLLAQLSHPNVVPVYDVGVHEGQRFVTMELIDGLTIGQWLRTPRRWREVLAVYLQAGQGLAAAHGKGVIHRDFKPDNVMVGSDERVRVMDFGLARDDSTAASDTQREASPAAEHTGLTQSGAIMGTPAYMAPEQHGGGLVGASADQFAFCVALYEGLFGRRPFAGNTRLELATNVVAGRVREPPSGRGIPVRIRRALLRGLSTNPQARWPNMGALLHELGDEREVRRRRRVVGVVVVGAAVGLGALRGPADPPVTCDGDRAKTEAIWSPDRRDAVDQALRATGAPDAGQTSARVQVSIDDYLEGWGHAHVAACEATQRGEQSSARLDRRVQCLDRGLQRVDALLELLAHADRELLHRSLEATAALPPLSRCNDDSYLDAEQPAPASEIRARVDAVQATLADAQAHQDAHKFSAGLQRLAAVGDEVQALDFAPITVAWQLRRGALAVRRGNAADSVADLEAAYLGARTQGLDEASFEAAVELAFAWGYQRANFELGEHWARLASAEANRLGDDRSAARALDAAAMTEMARHDFPAARGLFERALQRRIQAEGQDSLAVALTLTNLGATLTGANEPALAQQVLERALDGLLRHLGELNPRVGSVLNNLGNLHADAMELEQARAVHERALAIRRQTLEPGHPDIASSLNALGNLASARSDFDQASTLYGEAARIWALTLGTDHPKMALVLTNLAETQRQLGQLDQAEATLLRALEILDHSPGSSEGRRAALMVSLGWLSFDRGDLGIAQQRFESAMIDGAALRHRLDAHQGLMYVYLGRGKHAAALTQAEAAIAAANDGSASPEQRFTAQFWRILARYADPATRAEGLLEARRLANDMHAAQSPQLEWIDEWLANPGVAINKVRPASAQR